MVSRLLISLLITLPILTLLPAGVVGHAKLVSPIAWNSNPSKTQICGTAAGQTNPASFKVTPVDPTQLLTVQWTVVVGDGTGPLSASIDPAATNNPAPTDFSVKLTSVGTNNPSAVSTTPYNIQFQIPAGTVCTGVGQTCTLRVISTSNWVACATISIAGATTAPVTTNAPTTKAPTTNAPTSSNNPTTTAAPTSATTAPTSAPVIAANFVPYPSTANQCVVASGLLTCSSVNGQNVQLMGPSLAILDADVQDQLKFALGNPAVITTPNVAGCQQALTDLLCAQAFPACATTTPMICTSSCQRVHNLCAPNATLYADGTSHAQLYNCTNTQLGFTATTSDTTGNCPNVDTGIRPSSTTPTPNPGKKSDAVVFHSSIIIVSLTIVLAWLSRPSL